MITQEFIDTMPKYADTTHWFVPLTYNEMYIVDKSLLPDVESWHDAVIGCANIVDDKLDFDTLIVEHIGADVMGSIHVSWNSYINRPEYKMISYPELSMIDEYEMKLVGSVFIKEFSLGRNPDNSWKKLDKCMTWLRSTDFYNCPASTQYHDAEHSGLLNHSLKVADKAIELAALPTFKNRVRIEDAVFAALVHDWCKIGLYTSYKKNVKDEATGQWMQVDAYKRVDARTICLGHGVSSMYLVMKFFNISIEVAAAIRWHMGKWNCVEAEVDEMQQANENYPLVHLIQFADQLSIVNY